MINQQDSPGNSYWKHCRSIADASPEYRQSSLKLAGEDRIGRPLQKQQLQTQTMTIDQRFNNTKSNRRNFFFLMAAANFPATTEHSDHNHRTGK
jgi:hypothetical protein